MNEPKRKLYLQDGKQSIEHRAEEKRRVFPNVEENISDSTFVTERPTHPVHPMHMYFSVRIYHFLQCAAAIFDHFLVPSPRHHAMGILI